MTKSTSFILAAGLLAASSVACVADDRRNIGEVQGRQRARIHNGIEDGDLTHREARRLRERSQDIGEDRREALSDDGRIDRGERKHIRREQRNLNDDIYRERHDAQER
jgi:hypothetical protein